MLVDLLMLLPPGASLPRILPLLLLSKGILVPRSELNIQIIDLGHFSVCIEAMKWDGYIGVVQLCESTALDGMGAEPIFRCGCMGRILDLQDRDNGQLVLVIQGICRFEIEQELALERQVRRALVSYDRFKADVVQEADFSMDRKRLMAALKQYFKKVRVQANWEELSKTSNEKLIATLMMLCPFESSEKQALLETVGYEAQSRLVMSLIEMEAFHCQEQSPIYH
jgi:Lon protease-like protein